MHHQPIINNIVGLLILLLGIVVYPIGIQAGSNEQVKQMILNDLKNRTGVVDKRAEQKAIELLQKGVCPLDGSSLVVVDLPASGTYTDLWKRAYYCSDKDTYWIEKGNGAFIGTISLWYGSFQVQKSKESL